MKEQTPGREAVVRQLERILGSRDFDASARCRSLLRFVVEETLAGRETLLSDKAIAARVFGRNGDLDPDLDPIVWLQAGRLRRSLARFYRGAGAADPVLIELPRGTYVPVVRRSEAPPRDSASAAPTRLLART
jgi:hypothetical protein